jgi:hypothetical protein
METSILKYFYIVIRFIREYFFIAIFIVIPLVFFWRHRNRREALKKLSDYLHGSMVKFSLTPTLNGEYQGLRFSISLIQGGENSPSYLKTSLVKTSFFKLRIYKESILSHLGKKIGLVREIKINDEWFDSEFLIFSDRSQQAISYLGNEKIKDAIRELFNNGFNSLVIDNKKIIIQKPNYDLNLDLEPQKITGILQKLGLLAQGL